MTQDPSIIRHPVIKCGTAWGCAGVANVAEAATAAPPEAWVWLHSIPWGSLASLAAFLCSLVIFCEAVWKKVFRPIAQRLGWIKPRRRLSDLSDSEWASLRPGSDR